MKQTITQKLKLQRRALDKLEKAENLMMLSGRKDVEIIVDSKLYVLKIINELQLKLEENHAVSRA